MSELTDLKAELDALEEELQAVYRRLWPVREAYAQAAPPAALPSRRNRTDKQALIARCPRCGSTNPLAEQPNQPLLNAARRLVVATDNAERNYALADLVVALESEGAAPK